MKKQIKSLFSLKFLKMFCFSKFITIQIFLFFVIFNNQKLEEANYLQNYIKHTFLLDIFYDRHGNMLKQYNYLLLNQINIGQWYHLSARQSKQVDLLVNLKIIGKLYNIKVNFVIVEHFWK